MEQPRTLDEIMLALKAQGVEPTGDVDAPFETNEEPNDELLKLIMDALTMMPMGPKLEKPVYNVPQEDIDPLY